VGLREVFDEESCFVFASESADSLAAQFFAAYENREALKRMGMAARRVFERRLTLEAFGKSFLALVSEQIAESAPSASSEDGPKHHDRVIRCVIPNDRGEDCHMDPRAAEFLGALDPNTRILGLGRSPMATR
jgi:hypothetical protein